MATSSSNISGSELLSVALLNINGLRNKTVCIRQIISENELHVLALCETKLDSKVKDSKVYIPGFRMWRKDRDSHGGGVALYVQDHIETTLRSDLMETEAEIIWVEMKPPDNRPVLVGSYYKPKKDNAGLIGIYHTMTLASKEKKEKDIFLMGDVNIDWNKEKGGKTPNGISGLGLTQIVEVKTRYDKKKSSSCIDHIYTNIPELCSDPKSTETDFSDHNLITFMVDRNIPEKTIWCRSDEGFNEGSYIRDVKKAQWTNMQERSDPLSTFTDTFLSLADKHSTLQSLTIYLLLKADDEWISFITAKKAKKEKKENNESFESVLKQIEKKQKNIFRQEVKAAKHNPKKLLKIFQEVLGESLPSYVINITKEGDDQKHLHQTNTKPEEWVSDEYQLQNNLQTRESFSFRETDAETVKRWLTYFCDHVTGGIDQTELKLLKLAADYISVPICDILNGFIRNKKFPSELINPKTALMSGDKCTFFRENNRNHSVHIMLGLIFDVILREQTRQHFNLNDLMPSTKCKQQISQIQSDWIRATEGGKTVKVIFLDFSSLFQTISHDLLLYGFSDSALHLIKRYLSNHKRSCGLPQQGLLAQVLFHIFLNDLSSIFKHSSSTLFGKNLMIYAAEDNHERFEADLQSLRRWAEKKKIYLNETILVATKDTCHLFKLVLLYKLFKLNLIEVLKVVMQNHGFSWKNKYDSILKDLESYFGKRCLKAVPEKVKVKVINFLVQDQFGSTPLRKNFLHCEKTFI